MKLQLVRMPDQRDGFRRDRVHFITINDVIVHRLIENEIPESRWDYDNRVIGQVALYEQALSAKHEKTRGM